MQCAGSRNDVGDLRYRRRLECAVIRCGNIEARQALRRCIERIEAALSQLRGDLGTGAGEPAILLDHQQAAGLLNRYRARIPVDWPQTAQIDDFGFDVFLGKLISRFLSEHSMS